MFYVLSKMYGRLKFTEVNLRVKLNRKESFQSTLWLKILVTLIHIQYHSSHLMIELNTNEQFRVT